MEKQNCSFWDHLPLLMRASSRDSVERILQALWRTRKTGLDSADRGIIRDMLQLENDADLDPLLVCLRMLIRKCVYENTNKEDIHKLFPAGVSAELQSLLKHLLQKYQREWRDNVFKDQAVLPRLQAMTWNASTPDTETPASAAIINLRLQNNVRFHSEDSEVKFLVAKDALENMLESMHSIREQLCDAGEPSDGQLPEQNPL